MCPSHAQSSLLCTTPNHMVTIDSEKLSATVWSLEALESIRSFHAHDDSSVSCACARDGLVVVGFGEDVQSFHTTINAMLRDIKHPGVLVSLREQ